MDMESLLEWAEEEETSSVQADKTYTQLETVQHMLLDKVEGVCNTELLSIYIPRGSALIWTLRHEHGWDIDTLECDLHEHKNRQVKYVFNGRKY
tara:strand:+ start:1097 stop:1378 length:282 start_codon:yes stop_codon:yes gene_type:complete